MGGDASAKPVRGAEGFYEAAEAAEARAHEVQALRLKREPHNPYDRNAVAVHNVGTGAKVGHVQRIDALAIAAVADDAAMSVRMIGSVESGAHQTFKFPLRISFFGPAAWRPQVAHLLPPKHDRSTKEVEATTKYAPKVLKVSAYLPVNEK